MTVCEIFNLGLVDYQHAWDLQKEFAAEIAKGRRPPTLFLLEHPHTFTFGRRGDVANLLWNDAELARRGVTVHWVDRGGDVTYHGPGQLVGYPLLPLGKLTASGDAALPKADYVGFIRKLEQVIISAVSNFAVEAQQIEGLTGVWVANERLSVVSDQSSASGGQPSIAKLAAIGVRVDARGITQHGFALNVNPDMSYWEGIIGCGLQYPEISLAQLLDPVPSIEMIIEAVIQAFEKTFDFETQVKNFLQE
jgi:lipoyl(octanoyl) transferase